MNAPRPSFASVYSVGRDSAGAWAWWENWRCLGQFHTDVRPATDAEADLMDAISFGTDLPGDGQRLRALLDSAA